MTLSCKKPAAIPAMLVVTLHDFMVRARWSKSSTVLWRWKYSSFNSADWSLGIPFSVFFEQADLLFLDCRVPA
jgi:hypothetical protein